jgi:nucleoside 2-deoxyribosyltransferase
MIEPRLTEKPILYLASPLFSAAERSFNTFLKQALRQYFEVYLPQEDGALMPTLLDSGHSIDQACQIVFKNDMNAIRQADMVLIVLDGRAVDEGAAFELGAAYVLGKLCVGLQTDFRRLAPFGNNPMLSGALTKVYVDVESLLAEASALARSAALRSSSTI